MELQRPVHQSMASTFQSNWRTHKETPLGQFDEKYEPWVDGRVNAIDPLLNSSCNGSRKRQDYERKLLPLHAGSNVDRCR